MTEDIRLVLVADAGAVDAGSLAGAVVTAGIGAEKNIFGSDLGNSDFDDIAVQGLCARCVGEDVVVPAV